ncbi:MFS transporter [Gemella sp. GH3]|nr:MULTISPECIES: MFS transporter [unclassified Gemella]MBF0713631.1 MFS transporter [Gemella sp. GH3.1]NYS50583.1 MFS transporter [Gemella sp. GH3]
MSTSYKGTNKLLIGIVLAVLSFWLFAQSMLNIAPDVQKDLSISQGALNIGISITALFSGLFIVMVGGLADKVGRVKFVYIGLLLNIVGSFLLTISFESSLFIIGRAMQGLAAAFIMPATMALVKTYYEGKDRQRAVSFWSIGSWGGSGFCSLFGGAVSSSLGWRYVFIMSIIVSVISMLLIFGTPESKVNSSTKEKFDFIGLTIFIVSMLSLNVVISKAKELGIFSPYILALSLVVVVGLVVFYKVETSKDNSFIDFSLFKIKVYLGATISNFLLNAVAGTLIVINSYMQQGRGMNSRDAGMMSLGYLVCVLITIRIGEKFLQKFGSRTPMLLGTVITCIGVGLMTLTMVEGTAYLILVFVGYALFGTGLGIYATPSTDTALSSVPNDKVGSAAGIYKMASSLGGAIGVAISAAVYSALSAGGNFNDGATYGLIINILFCIFSIISIVVIIPKKQ